MQGFRSALAAAALLAVPMAASADVVGFDFGVYGWQASPEGYIQDEDVAGNNRADLEQDLGLDKDETGVVVWAALEHPVPVLPNLKLQYTPLEFEGVGTPSRSFTFDGQTFNVSDRVVSDIDLTQLDVVLYYEVLDNTLSLDLGLNFKVLNGEVLIVSDSGERYQEDLTGAVPMLYMNAAVELPANLSLGLEASGIGYSGNRYTDIKAALAWQVAMVSVEAGYRVQQLVLDDLGGVSADFEIAGPYAGAALKF